MNNDTVCFTGISKHGKIIVKKRRPVGVFLSIFSSAWIPGETKTPVVKMTSQMNTNIYLNHAEFKFKLFNKNPYLYQVTM